MDNAARWWVNYDRRLRPEVRTWTNLKEGLLQRYGPPVNLDEAEWRVNSRKMFHGESYADFAAGLREAAERNDVEERVFLAQFYREIDRVTRQLVKQPPVPRTLEQAVRKARDLNDPLETVAPRMQNLGQTDMNGPAAVPIQLTDANQATMVVPGIGGIKLPVAE
ncbi:hypothetical protein P3T76_007389 [Phytophthora citrophthora]|uniref:Retrotransposon gag domain-containing protein n=1 Tax=Phytophthora citrophthora TaxID=4793 RepID=A0AAD9GNS9_9STRA|nr:hypothetical protein P3T76_007389 [Phytophthora citrophthora]